MERRAARLQQWIGTQHPGFPQVDPDQWIVDLVRVVNSLRSVRGHHQEYPALAVAMTEFNEELDMWNWRLRYGGGE